MKRARIQLILSMAIFGTIGLFVRNIPVSSGELALCRAVLASLMIGGYLLLTGQRLPWHSVKKEIFPLLLSGMAMGVNWVLLFEAYKYTTLSAATLSYYFAPVIVTIVCPFLFRERLSAGQIFCFVMSTVGLVLLIGPEGLKGNASDLFGILLGLGAAVCYASVILVNKFIKGVSGIHRTLLQFLAAILILAPYVWVTGGIHLGEMDAKGWIYMLIVGIVHTGITYCMYFSSLKELPGQKVAILSYIDPCVALLVSLVILHERMTLLQAAGGVLILGFALWNEIISAE